VTGKNFDHRRDWIEERLLDLANSFAVALYAWALMDNHCHVVLAVDPRLPEQWSDVEVASRWCRLSASDRRGYSDKESEQRRQRETDLLSNPTQLQVIRDRLGSISWFNRYLKEAIAREANAEDGCTGCFWESRFGCQPLLDEQAILTCMAYVDLNPIRAGAAISLADSSFTSIKRRLDALAAKLANDDDLLSPLAGSARLPGPSLSIRSYIELLEWTGRQRRDDKRGVIDPATPPALVRLRAPPEHWLDFTTDLFRFFRIAIGSQSSLAEFAKRSHRTRVQGSRYAWD